MNIILFLKQLLAYPGHYEIVKKEAEDAGDLRVTSEQYDLTLLALPQGFNLLL